MEHFRLGFGFGLGQSTARMASSKTVLSPFCVKAEHSRYFTAPISFAMANPFSQKSNTKTDSTISSVFFFVHSFFFSWTLGEKGFDLA